MQNQNKIIVIINGPSNAGKSTTIAEIFKIRKDFFHLKYDALKRFFIDYDSSREIEKVKEFSGVIGRSRIDKNENILIESDSFDKTIIGYAKEKNYSIFEFNVEAPYEVLLSRFRERVLNAVSGIKINTSEEKLLKIHNEYLSSKKIEVKTFDTSKQTAEEVAKEILEDINAVEDLKPTNPSGVKDFYSWVKLKKELDKSERKPFAHTREVWWVSLGINIGAEADGKNENFERPCIILKVYNTESLLILPITSKAKEDKFHFKIEVKSKNVNSKKVVYVKLTHPRIVSVKRLIRKVDTVNKEVFQDIKKMFLESI